MSQGTPVHRHEEVSRFETVIDVVGVERAIHGRSCERHEDCGSIV